MARVTFRETREKGNYITGDYERTTREVEFEGSAIEVNQLIQSTSSFLRLPGIKTRNGFLGSHGGNEMMARLLKQPERRY